MDSQVSVRSALRTATGLDSQVLVFPLDVVDDAWKADKLPQEDVAVPFAELPDPESDSGDPHLTLRKSEEKWNDLALNNLRIQSPSQN